MGDRRRPDEPYRGPNMYEQQKNSNKGSTTQAFPIHHGDGGEDAENPSGRRRPLPGKSISGKY